MNVIRVRVIVMNFKDIHKSAISSPILATQSRSVVFYILHYITNLIIFLEIGVYAYVNEYFDDILSYENHFSTGISMIFFR